MEWKAHLNLGTASYCNFVCCKVWTSSWNAMNPPRYSCTWDNYYRMSQVTSSKHKTECAWNLLQVLVPLMAKIWPVRVMQSRIFWFFVIVQAVKENMHMHGSWLLKLSIQLLNSQIENKKCDVATKMMCPPILISTHIHVSRVRAMSSVGRVPVRLLVPKYLQHSFSTKVADSIRCLAKCYEV